MTQAMDGFYAYFRQMAAPNLKNRADCALHQMGGYTVSLETKSLALITKMARAKVLQYVFVG